MSEQEQNDLHEMRVLLYEDGWDSIGTPQERLRVVLQRWQETRDANIKLTTREYALRAEIETLRTDLMLQLDDRKTLAERAKAQLAALRTKVIRIESQASILHENAEAEGHSWEADDALEIRSLAREALAAGAEEGK